MTGAEYVGDCVVRGYSESDPQQDDALPPPWRRRRSTASVRVAVALVVNDGGR